MEQRRENRVPLEELINITVLGEPEKRLTATVKNASGRGIGLISSESIPSGAAVKIEIGDSVFLGEAMYCKALAEGGYCLGIELTEVLSGLAALSRMAQEFSQQMGPDWGGGHCELRPRAPGLDREPAHDHARRQLTDAWKISKLWRGRSSGCRTAR